MVSKQVLSILLISMAAIVMVTFLSSDSVSFFKKGKKIHFADAAPAAVVVTPAEETKLTTAYTTELTTPCETACPAVNAAKTADSVKANADCKTACAE